MKRTGGKPSKRVTLSYYDPKPDYVEVRLRENVRQHQDGEFEYDEYVIHVKEKDGLQAEIESNLAEWLATGRMLEVNENASVVQDMRTEIANAVSTGDLEAAYKEGVNSI